MTQVKVAVIGGSGLYKMEGLTATQKFFLDTPFGKPSDEITIGQLEGVAVAFLPRHGREHTIAPTEVPYRANIYCLKALGVEHIIAVNSVGSFREEIKPGDLVIPDQIIDRTTRRTSSFFDGNIVVHIPFSEPFCPVLRGILLKAATDAGISTHAKGIYLAMEGPAFSSRAESRLYRSWGADIIGMTAQPEAKLAREAEMCYSIIAGVTDYDSWQEAGEHFSVETIVQILGRNNETMKNIIRLAVKQLPEQHNCECTGALRNAFATDLRNVSSERKRVLGLLIGKYSNRKEGI
jgi:5'-methylthioadenosine phosphorylase